MRKAQKSSEVLRKQEKTWEEKSREIRSQERQTSRNEMRSEKYVRWWRCQEIASCNDRAVRHPIGTFQALPWLLSSRCPPPAFPLYYLYKNVAINSDHGWNLNSLKSHMFSEHLCSILSSVFTSCIAPTKPQSAGSWNSLWFPKIGAVCPLITLCVSFCGTYGEQEI